MADLNMEDLKKVADEAKSLVEQLKQTEASSGERTEAELKQINDRIDEGFKKFDEANEEVARKAADTLKREEEQKQRIDELEAKLSKTGNLSTNSEEHKFATEECKNFFKYMNSTVIEGTALNDAELKTLRTDIATEGGVFVPDVLMNEIIKDITEMSNIRRFARVQRTTSDNMEMFRRTGRVSSNWVQEGETFPESNPKYGKERVPVHYLSVKVESTTQMLKHAMINVESEIFNEYAEEKARAEGFAFVKGNGIYQPEGLMTNNDVTELNSGNATDLDFDALIELTGELKTGYNPWFYMNRRTISRVRRLKDGQGQYLWQAGNLVAGAPSTIAGDPYAEVPDMDDIAADAFPILYADLRRGYLIVDGFAVEVIRDPFTKDARVIHKFLDATGGQVIQPEAMIKLKIST